MSPVEVENEQGVYSHCADISEDSRIKRVNCHVFQEEYESCCVKNSKGQVQYFDKNMHTQIKYLVVQTQNPDLFLLLHFLDEAYPVLEAAAEANEHELRAKHWTEVV